VRRGRPCSGSSSLLSEATWDVDAVTEPRIAHLVADPFTAPHAAGVLVLDDTGDRKDGTAIAHVARQYLGSVGKSDNGIVAVTSLWADARVYYPLHVAPYTPAGRLPNGKHDPAFRTKPQIALRLVEHARTAGIPFRAVVADSGYGDNGALEDALVEGGVPHVLAHRGPDSRCWAPADQPHSFDEALDDVPHEAWTRVVRHFRDGRTETWWAVELTFGGYGPDRATRAIVATTDRQALPALSTWYLSTNLSRAEAPAGQGRNPMILNLRGTGTAETRTLVINGVPAPNQCFTADLIDVTIERVVGKGPDCIVARPGDKYPDGLEVIGTTIYDFGHGHTFTSRGLTSVQPTTHGSPDITHITGAIPPESENSIVATTGRYRSAAGAGATLGRPAVSRL